MFALEECVMRLAGDGSIEPWMQAQLKARRELIRSAVEEQALGGLSARRSEMLMKIATSEFRQPEADICPTVLLENGIEYRRVGARLVELNIELDGVVRKAAAIEERGGAA